MIKDGMPDLGMVTYWWEIPLYAFVGYLIFCPPKYDPAIRFKIWLEGRKHGNSVPQKRDSRDS